MKKPFDDSEAESGQKMLSKKEEALFWVGLAGVCLMSAAGFLLFALYSHNILNLTMLISYGLDAMGLFVSFFIYFGCMCSRRIQNNCSGQVARILILTDVLLLFDATLCIFRESIPHTGSVRLLAYPLFLDLMYLLWKYVREAIPPEDKPVRIKEEAVRRYEMIGIALWAVFFIFTLVHPDTTANWGRNLIFYEHLVLNPLVFLILLAVNIQVFGSRTSLLQKLFTVLASLFLISFLVTGLIGNERVWRLETNVAYGLVILLICGTVFPDRIRIQEIISRVFAVVLLIAAVIYGQLISVTYYDKVDAVAQMEAAELLEAGASVLRGVSPDDLKDAVSEDPVLEILNHIIEIAHAKLVFCETIDAASGERREIIELVQSQNSVKLGKNYPDIDLKSLLPDSLLPEEKAALSGQAVNQSVTQITQWEMVTLQFYPWEDGQGENVGLIVACSFPERLMVEELSALFSQAFPVLLLILAGALMLSVILDLRLIRGVNITIKNIRKFFGGEGWSEETIDFQGSYEGFYFSRILSFLIEELRDRETKLVTEIKERERINADLDLAAVIQTNIMPNHFPPFPDRSEFSIYASMHPARVVGGDFYDFYLLDSDRLVLVVADVSGKGIPAALFMMTARSILKSAMVKYENPAEALAEANRQLAEENEERMFVTTWIGILELDSGKLITANAGHEKMLLYRNGTWEYSDEKPGAALGLFPQVDKPGYNSPLYSNFEVSLSEGDMLFQCTDGVTECVNGEKKFFGRERLLETLGQFSGADPETLVDGVNGRLDQFRDREDQFDDITVLSLQYRGALRKTDGLLSGENSVEGIMDKRDWMIVVPEHAAFTQIRDRIREICPALSEAKSCILVCDEIFHNIVQYAEADRIWFFCENRETELEIGFMDNGNLFDAASVMIREKEFEDLSSGGMGITVIRTLTKNLRYERIGDRNLLCASVERKGANPPGQEQNDKGGET